MPGSSRQPCQRRTDFSAKALIGRPPAFSSAWWLAVWGWRYPRRCTASQQPPQRRGLFLYDLATHFATRVGSSMNIKIGLATHQRLGLIVGQCR
jgi:hypothetical protein